MDEDRILSKFREIDSYLEEIDDIKPDNFREYKNSVKDRRACERLLQISIESVIDICNIVYSGMRNGMPIDESDVFRKLNEKKVISNKVFNIIDSMKGLRNILVHKYGEVKDEIVFEMLSERLNDFEKFKEEILKYLKNGK